MIVLNAIRKEFITCFSGLHLFGKLPGKVTNSPQMPHVCPLTQVTKRKSVPVSRKGFAIRSSFQLSSWCFVPQRSVFPVLSISCSIKSQLYPPLTLSSGKSPDLQAERDGAGQVWLSNTSPPTHASWARFCCLYINLENHFSVFQHCLDKLRWKAVNKEDLVNISLGD